MVLQRVFLFFLTKAADLALKMVPEGVKVQLTDYKTPLSAAEHNILVQKVIGCFEMDVSGFSSDQPLGMQLASNQKKYFCKIKNRAHDNV